MPSFDGLKFPNAVMVQKWKERSAKSTYVKQTICKPKLYVIAMEMLLNGFWSEESFSKRLLSFIA